MIVPGPTPSGLPGPGLLEVQLFEAEPSPGLAGWLAEEDVALAVSTGNQVLLVGRGAGGEVRVASHAHDVPAGLATDGVAALHLATRWQLWRLQDALAGGGPDADGHDRLYLPQTARTTGAVGAFDLGIGTGGRLLFTSATCNCVGMPSRRTNFTAVWKPPFVSELVGEDRCHLTGLAVDRAGELAYVTCAGVSDRAGGWREHQRGGGVVVHAPSGEVVATGLSLPHSPRIHADGRLFVADGLTGELVTIDPVGGVREVITRVPGLARGLTFTGRWAVLGCSEIKDDDALGRGPALAGTTNRLAIVDLVSGRIAHELRLTSGSINVVAVAVLAATRRPGLVAQMGGTPERLSLDESSRAFVGRMK